MVIEFILNKRIEKVVGKNFLFMLFLIFVILVFFFGNNFYKLVKLGLNLNIVCCIRVWLRECISFIIIYCIILLF